MKTATPIDPSVRGWVDDMIVLPKVDEVEHQLCKVNALIAFYRELQSLCYMMLTIAAIGTVLYGAGVFLSGCLLNGK